MENKFNKSTKRRRGKSGAFVAIGIAAIMALTACSTSAPDSNSPDIGDTGNESSGQPVVGGTLTVGIGGSSSTDTLDPHNAVNTISIAVVAQFAETLLKYDSDFQIAPNLATSVEPNEDATSWTINLRDDVRFQDGNPMTADDVKFTFEKILDKDNPGAAAAQLASLEVENIEIIDEHTLVVPFSQPFAMFQDSLAMAATSAVRVVPRGFDVENPIGTGPFVLDSFTPGQVAHLVKNDDYWLPGQPYLDAVEIQAINDDGARVNALIAGQVDAITSVSAGSVEILKNEPSVELLISESGSWNPIVMRTDIAPFDDPKVREAFKLIVDREELVNAALAGQGQVANDLYGRFDPGFNTGLEQREQNIERAKELLEESGHAGLQVEMITSKISEGVVPAAQVFVQQAAEAGVTINLLEVQPTDFWSKHFLNAPLTQSNWATRNYLQQAADSMLPTAPYPETRWSNDEWLSLVEKAIGTADESERNQLISEAQKIEWDEGGYINWGWYNTVDGVSDKLHGLESDASGISLNTFGFHNAWLED